MSKILLINTSLKHGQSFMEPFMQRLIVHLSKEHVVDVRNAQNFEEGTFFEYDQVVFVFFTALDSIPSSTLEIFEKLESHHSRQTEVYALIACDEYEAEKCNLSEKVIKNWATRENLIFKGSLKIGSALIIMKTASKFIVSNYIKDFASAISKHEETDKVVSILTEKLFMRLANKYWEKEIHKKLKEKK